jgi:hypothetical protein
MWLDIFRKLTLLGIVGSVLAWRRRRRQQPRSRTMRASSVREALTRQGQRSGRREKRHGLEVRIETFKNVPGEQGRGGGEDGPRRTRWVL